MSKKLSEINHCKIIQDSISDEKKRLIQSRRDLIKKLRGLGYETENFSFGVDVISQGRLVFHGRNDEIEAWLIENGEM